MRNRKGHTTIRLFHYQGRVTGVRVRLGTPVTIRNPQFNVIGVRDPVPLIRQVNLYRGITSIGFQRHGSKGVTRGTKRTRRVLTFRVYSIKVTMRLYNRRILPLLGMKTSIGANQVPKVFKGACVLPISPRMRGKVRSIGLRMRFPTIPIHERFGDTTMKACKIPFLMKHVVLIKELLRCVEPKTFGKVQLVKVGKNTMALDLPKKERLGLLPILCIMVQLMGVNQTTLKVLHPIRLPLAIRKPTPFAIFERRFRNKLRVTREHRGNN